MGDVNTHVSAVDVFILQMADLTYAEQNEYIRVAIAFCFKSGMVPMRMAASSLEGTKGRYSSKRLIGSSVSS